MENVYWLLVVIFGILAGIKFGHVAQYKKKRRGGEMVGALMMAVVFTIVMLWALYQIWAK